ITDAEGRYLANTRVPAGEELGISEYREAIDEALAAHKPIVSDLLESSHGGWQFKILVPVETDAGTRYVLGYSPPNDSVRRLISDMVLPDRWRAAILDSDGRIVARSKDHELFFGTLSDPNF